MKRILLLALLVLSCQSPGAPVQPVEIVLPDDPPSVPVVDLPEPTCPACEPSHSENNPEVDPACPCVWTKALSLVVTEFESDPSRDLNLKRASSLIYGTILQSGETFSFNETVGPRSETNGFHKAKVIFDGVLIDDWGGGVCQVSSTLHLAVLQAGILPTQRTPHSRPSSYTKLGLDAAVSWPEQCWDKPEKSCHRTDLKFQNTYSFPIGIKMWVSGNWVVAGLYADVDLDLKVDIQTRYSHQGQFNTQFRKSYRVRKPRKIQNGRRGLQATTTVSVTDSKGRTSFKGSYPSRYPPTPEVWEVPVVRK